MTFDPAEVSFCFPRGPLRWLMAAKNVNHWLKFEFQSSHDIENRNNITLYRPWSWKTNLAEMMVHEEKGWTWCSSENSGLLQMWLGSNLWPGFVEVEFPVGLPSCPGSCSPVSLPSNQQHLNSKLARNLWIYTNRWMYTTPFCTFVFLYFFEKKN